MVDDACGADEEVLGKYPVLTLFLATESALARPEGVLTPWRIPC